MPDFSTTFASLTPVEMTRGLIIDYSHGRFTNRPYNENGKSTSGQYHGISGQPFQMIIDYGLMIIGIEERISELEDLTEGRERKYRISNKE